VNSSLFTQVCQGGERSERSGGWYNGDMNHDKWLFWGALGFLPQAPALQAPMLPAQLSDHQVRLLTQLKAALEQYHSGPLPERTPAYTPPVDESLAQLVNHPSVGLILGHRGSGKSALAIRLQELLRDIAAPYAVGLPAKASRLLPDWYGLADDFDTIPNNAIIYIPESYRLFHARSAQSVQGRALGDLVNLSRHRRWSLIFDAQNPSHLDRNIVSEADLVLVKEPGPVQQGFERKQFKDLMDSARAAFAGVGPGRKKKVVWVVGSGVSGQLMENMLPTFWTDSLSRIFGDTTVGLGGGLSMNGVRGNGLGVVTAAPRRGKRTSIEDKREKARKMKAAGYSFGEIANTLGISRSYAHKLVNQPE